MPFAAIVGDEKTTESFNIPSDDMSLHRYLMSRSDMFNDNVIFENLLQIVKVEGDWMYLSPNTIKHSLGYVKSDSAYNNLRKNYVKDTDYQIVDDKHDLVVQYRIDNKQTRAVRSCNQLYFIVTKSIYLKMLRESRAKKSNADRYLEYIERMGMVMVTYYAQRPSEMKELMDRESNVEYTEEQNNKYKQPRKVDLHDGSVYFIHEAVEGDQPVEYYKIGKACDVEERIATLQTGNRRKLILYATIKSKKVFELEHTIHVEMAAHRDQGEWFKITKEEVDRLVAKYSNSQ